MTSPFKPNLDRIVIRRDDSVKSTAGGIMLVEMSQSKSQEGEIILIGDGDYNEAGDRKPMDVSVGDKVLFPIGVGTDIKLDGEDLLIMRQGDIFSLMGSKDD